MTENTQGEDPSVVSKDPPPHPIPKEHRSLDYLLSQIPRRAQKGLLTTCDLILKCVDANADYIALGTNVGVIYLFDRKKELIEKLKTHSNNDVITTIALHTGLESQVAIGTEKGVVYIFQLPSHIPGQNKKLQEFVVQGLHKARVTCSKWSLNGMKLFTGDDQGLVVCTEFDAFQGQCKSAVVLSEAGSSVVQLDHGHKSLLVSTKQRTVIYKMDESTVQVGQKDRKIAGQFGACFIPAMCKPEDAQLYACRPGARIWKADMNGLVSQTYLYKELLNSTHPEIQLLFKNGIPASRVSADHQFGPLSLYMEKYLVTWNDSSMYVLCPEDNSVVGSQRALGAVVDVAVTEDEIFILRKNNEKNLIRVALYPEKKGESLYHKLLHEKEKYALMRQSAPPIESTLHVSNIPQSSQQSHSPLDFIQTKLKSMELTGGSVKSGIEHFLSSMDHLEDSVEITEHEIDHRDHPQAQPPQDLPPEIKHVTKLHEKLPPVVKLETPDLLTIEVFGDDVPSFKKDTSQDSSNKMSDIPTTRFNPFLKDDLETDSVSCSADSHCDNSFNKHSLEASDKLIPRGPSNAVSQSTKDSSPSHNPSMPTASAVSQSTKDSSPSHNPSLPTASAVSQSTKDGSSSPDLVIQTATLTEERLSSAVGDDNIVFNSKIKRHKKKKKGSKGDRESGHPSHGKDHLHGNMEDRISIQSYDSISIQSDASESSYVIEEPKLMTVVDSVGNVKKIRSRESSPSPSTCCKKLPKGEQSHLAVPFLENSQNSAYDSLTKSLEKFEEELTSLDTVNSLKKKEEVKLENKDSVLESAKTRILTSEKEKLSSEKSIVLEPKVLKEKSKDVTLESSVLKTNDTQVAKRSSSLEKLNATMQVSNSSSSDNSLIMTSDQGVRSVFSTPESPTDDFYTMYLSNTSVTSQKDVKHHPLLPSTADNETLEDEGTDLVNKDDKFDHEPSYKIINSWTEVYTTGNVACLCLTDTHIWHVDRSSNLWYCSLNSPGFKWQKANGYAKMVAVSHSGSIVWRLYKDTVYAGTKIVAKHPEGMKWIEAVREVQYISVDETMAWYIKTNGEVVMQKGLSRDRPCFKALKIACDHKLIEIACYRGVVIGVTDQCQLVYRDGISKDCWEGKWWKQLKCKSSQEMLFSAISFGVDGVLWALDVLGRIWFTTGVTMETPTGDGKWWEVPVSEIVVKDVSGIDALRSLAQKFDPQKLASLLSSQNAGLITAGRCGVWVCPEFKNMIQICRGVIQGHLWDVAEIRGIASSVIWKSVSAQASNDGFIWALQPNGDIYTFSAGLEKCSQLLSPSYKKPIICLCTSRDAVWVLMEDGAIFIRSGVRPSNPQGVDWCRLDLSQLGDTVLTSISCGTLNVWAVDNQGIVYQRIGVKAPTSHSLNAAWLPVDMGKQSTTVFTHIATGPKDFMVWAIDNRRQVYARRGVTENMPIGEEWVHVPGTLATQLTVSDTCVWALNPNGEILCRYGISLKNPTGDYWRKVPGVFYQISVSDSDQMWGVSKEGQLYKRYTKCLKKGSNSALDQLLPKRSSVSMSSDDGWELL
uniref:HPS5-like beta-propeller domain-containing protein n=1 Tax=Magallana gigas TaxID=29159 RepID=K1PQU1_MAGGI|eukprot:XP_011444745.1 PREDICTED: tectonin beta-propeller repeat-containing protein 2 isoform X1 [Crassostrea gigas]